MDKTASKTVASLTVFVASVWWCHCDPFTRIVGNDAAVVRKAAQSAMRDAAKDAYQGDSDEDKGIDDYMDDLCWSGVHSMSLSDLVSEREIAMLEPDYSQLVSGAKDAIVYLLE